METSELENAILIDEKEVFSARSNRNDNSNILHFLIGTQDCYKIYAHPGPEVTMNGRSEHLPYHIHIKYPRGGELARVNIETLETMKNSSRLPRDLKNYLKTNHEELLEKTKDIYHTGKLKDSYN